MMQPESQAESRRFHDRREAGRALAEQLGRYAHRDVVVLGIPRGGLVIAAEVAQRLDAELDVVVVRKLGAPGAPELAIGAISAEGSRFLNEATIRQLGVSEDYLRQITEYEIAEARRRVERLRPAGHGAELAGRTVIVVDDGLATGATMQVSLRVLRGGRPGRLVVAVPVGSAQACRALEGEADEVVCLVEPPDLGAIGFYYDRFDQVTDDEAKELLESAQQRRSARRG